MANNYCKWSKELGYSDGEEPPHWLIEIDRRLKKAKLHTIRARASWTISVVPDKLRSVQGTAFNPKIVSIGPIHQGNSMLRDGEKYKKEFLVQFLQGKFPVGYSKEEKEMFIRR